MGPDSLLGAAVELSAPDGRVFRFSVSALIPYGGALFAVLEEEGGAQQLLVTRVETGGNGAPIFLVEGDEAVIDAVLGLAAARLLTQALDQTDDPANDGARAGSVAFPAHPVSCTCGRCRQLPSYIRQWKPQ